MPFKISIELLNANGTPRERQELPYRFDTEGAARIKADELAAPYVNRRYIEQRGFWEYTEPDGTRARIVIDLA